jgi:hypothetical protein
MISNLGFKSSKRLVLIFNSCASSNKKKDVSSIESPGHENLMTFKPPLLTLETGLPSQQWHETTRPVLYPPSTRTTVGSDLR